MKKKVEYIYSKNNGFTLIELSIVLVIVALLAGGILVGQELIHAAYIRDAVSKVEKINTAVNTFRLKYNCLPGDCPNATQFFAGSSQPEQVSNGNGDKGINGLRYARPDVYGSGVWKCNNGNYNITNMGASTYIGWIAAGTCPTANVFIPEWLGAWDHLAAAGLVEEVNMFDETSTTSQEAGKSFPKVNLKNISSASAVENHPGGIVFGYVPSSPTLTPYMKSGHKITLGICGTDVDDADGIISPYTHHCSLNAWDTFRIDEKIDDGKPFSGKMVNIGYHNTYRTAYVWGYTHNGNHTRGCGEAPEDLLAGGNYYQSEKTWSAFDNGRRTICAPYINAQF